MSDTLADRGGICTCGAIGKWTLTFGGRRPAHFTCDRCHRRFDLDGKLMEP